MTEVEQLREEIAKLRERIAALEARPTLPALLLYIGPSRDTLPGFNPFQPPYTVTC